MEEEDVQKKLKQFSVIIKFFVLCGVLAIGTILYVNFYRPEWRQLISEPVAQAYSIIAIVLFITMMGNILRPLTRTGLYFVICSYVFRIGNNLANYFGYPMLADMLNIPFIIGLGIGGLFIMAAIKQKLKEETL